MNTEHQTLPACRKVPSWLRLGFNKVRAVECHEILKGAVIKT
jgi:hypothetical protein